MKNYKKFFEDVRQWQIVIKGNDCTICHGHNMYSQCDCCKWWGLVNPSDPAPIERDITAPCLSDPQYDL